MNKYILTEIMTTSTLTVQKQGQL